MRLLSPYQVMERTGLTYSKSLLIVKAGRHVQIGNRYFISETALKEILNPTTPIQIKEEN